MSNYDCIILLLDKAYPHKHIWIHLDALGGLISHCNCHFEHRMINIAVPFWRQQDRHQGQWKLVVNLQVSQNNFEPDTKLNKGIRISVDRSSLNVTVTQSNENRGFWLVIHIKIHHRPLPMDDTVAQLLEEQYNKQEHSLVAK